MWWHLGRGKEFLHLSYERQSLADVGGNLSFFFCQITYGMVLQLDFDAVSYTHLDAYESAYTIMLNLNKTWVQKQGDFFPEYFIYRRKGDKEPFIYLGEMPQYGIRPKQKFTGKKLKICLLYTSRCV